MSYPCLLIYTMVVCFLLVRSAKYSSKAYLKVHFFPVGEGDATIIECNEAHNGTGGKVALTLVNAGSRDKRKESIQEEYLRFFESRLTQPNYFLKNIILMNADVSNYNFIVPMMFVKSADRRKLHFYIGGRRTWYSTLDDIFNTYKNVFEFTRRNVTRGSVASCGHFDKEGKFLNCVKKDKWSPIEESNEIIEICDDFQISVMAANFGSSPDKLKLNAATEREGRNSLTLKLTPSGKQSPSILLGDFEDDGDNKDNSNNNNNEIYYNYIMDAHDYYTRAETSPRNLASGLSATVINIPQRGAITHATISEKFYSDFVQPSFAVVSSGITDSHGHPKCEVLEAVNNYLSMFSPAQKTYQCYPINSNLSRDIEVRSGSSDNLHQTSIIDQSDFPHANVRYNLITFTMTSNEIRKPTTRMIYQSCIT